MSIRLRYGAVEQALGRLSKDQSDRWIEEMYNLTAAFGTDEMKARVDSLRQYQAQNSAPASTVPTASSSSPLQSSSQAHRVRSTSLPEWNCGDCGKVYKRLDYAEPHIHKHHRTNSDRLLAEAKHALARPLPVVSPGLQASQYVAVRPVVPQGYAASAVQSAGSTNLATSPGRNNGLPAMGSTIQGYSNLYNTARQL